MVTFRKFNQRRFLSYFLIAGVFFLLDFGPFFVPIKNVFTQVFRPVRLSTYQIGQIKLEQLFYSRRLKQQEEEIQKLERQLIGVTGKITELQQLHDENKRLKELISSPIRERGFSYRSAWVIGRQGDHLIIDQGEKDGVLVGQLVVSEEHHLVGRVAEAYDQEAKILVIGSVSLELPVLIFSNWEEGCFDDSVDCQRTRGIIAGGVIKDVLREEKVSVGDMVALLDGPRGILIGKISRVQESRDNIFKQAEVEKSINLDRLVEVFLVSQ